MFRAERAGGRKRGRKTWSLSPLVGGPREEAGIRKVSQRTPRPNWSPLYSGPRPPRPLLPPARGRQHKFPPTGRQRPYDVGGFIAPQTPSPPFPLSLSLSAPSLPPPPFPLPSALSLSLSLLLLLHFFLFFLLPFLCEHVTLINVPSREELSPRLPPFFFEAAQPHQPGGGGGGTAQHTHTLLLI